MFLFYLYAMLIPSLRAKCLMRASESDTWLAKMALYMYNDKDFSSLWYCYKDNFYVKDTKKKMWIIYPNKAENAFNLWFLLVPFRVLTHLIWNFQWYFLITCLSINCQSVYLQTFLTLCFFSRTTMPSST